MPGPSEPLVSLLERKPSFGYSLRTSWTTVCPCEKQSGWSGLLGSPCSATNLSLVSPRSVSSHMQSGQRKQLGLNWCGEQRQQSLADERD